MKVTRAPDFPAQDLRERLDLLARCVRSEPRENPGGRGLVNLHIHTSESFSFFESPTEAVWYAYREGIEYCGINDHYTIEGHPEFAAACRIAGLQAAFSIEAISMNYDFLRDGIRYNDPVNAGRVYLVGKGIVRDLKSGGKSWRILKTMRGALAERNEEILAKLNGYAADRGIDTALRYADVLTLTPRGNATERHVVQRFCDRLEELFPRREERLEAYRKLLGGDAVGENDLDDHASLQTAVRSHLVKAGKPCYAEESPEAYTTLENMIDMYLEYGSVPTYPMMGNPITEGEADLEEMVAFALKNRMIALDMIDFRTRTERCGEILEIADAHGLPVFIGTEHNTKETLPMIGHLAGDPEFQEYFRRSAQFVTGHQLLSKLCGFGAVTEEGKPRIDDLREGFALFSGAGAMNLSPEEVEELEQRDLRERKQFFNI
jgi:hypothetical protein